MWITEVTMSVWLLSH